MGLMQLDGQRVTVMGLGRFGGGEGLVQFLLQQGAAVSVSDQADADTLEPTLARIEAATGSRPVVFDGGHHDDHFTDTDLVVVNPAVPRPWDNPFVHRAQAAGVPLTTAMRLLVDRLPNRDRVIGITGSVGKSTTAAMVHWMLTHTGHDARLGGNFGGSLLPDLDSITSDTWIVLECSSAQLHWLDARGAWPGWSPHIAVTTPISPNHLDWHGDEAHYRRSKAVLTAFQLPHDIAISQVTIDDTSPITLRLPGTHNVDNARLALAATQAAGVDRADASAALATFAGLPHRLQPLDGWTTDRFWNDAKSSTPAATMLALDAFADRLSHVHLIVGGYDKGVSLDDIAARSAHLGGLYCIGATGETIAASAGDHATICGTLDVAVARALECMHDTDLLVLSPGCASWDQYTDFRQRGAHFESLVRSMSPPDADQAMAPTSEARSSAP